MRWLVLGEKKDHKADFLSPVFSTINTSRSPSDVLMRSRRCGTNLFKSLENSTSLSRDSFMLLLYHTFYGQIAQRICLRFIYYPFPQLCLKNNKQAGLPWWSGGLDSTLPKHGERVRSLAGELRPHILCGMAKKIKNQILPRTRIFIHLFLSPHFCSSSSFENCTPIKPIVQSGDWLHHLGSPSYRFM